MTFKEGDIVKHNSFGTGIVKWVNPDGKIEIDFGDGGFKTIAGKFYHLLTPVDSVDAPELENRLLTDMRGLSRNEKYYRNYWDGCWEFNYSKSLRERNMMDSCFIKEWYGKYNSVSEGILFDEDDLKLATGKQRTNHFHEWYAAVTLYEKYGYLSLVEKYELSKSHPRKHGMLRTLAGDEFAKFADSGRKIEIGGKEKLDQRQCPDLLVYKPDLTEWFFCEVKAGEEITLSQDSFFPIVRKMTGKPVYLLVLS